jgi:excinuclease ABC subunit B
MLRYRVFAPWRELQSRFFAGRDAESHPTRLWIILVHGDWLLVVDESHVALPATQGHVRRRLWRETMLVKHGYRLPSALDTVHRKRIWDQITKAGSLFLATPASKS